MICPSGYLKNLTIAPKKLSTFPSIINAGMPKTNAAPTVPNPVNAPSSPKIVQKLTLSLRWSRVLAELVVEQPVQLYSSRHDADCDAGDDQDESKNND